jgi:succinoglycan biosynthesis protein ExoA
MADLPLVTVAVPVLNEEHHLGACLDSIVAQSYLGKLEVLVVDGGSTDASRSIAGLYPQVKTLDNPRRIQAAALNIALAEAHGEVFVRVDGHSTIAPDFVARSVEALETTGAAMVGAGLRPRTDGSWFERAVAAAIVSPLGGGPAAYRRGGRSRWVDGTVFLASFRTQTARELGGYHEHPGVNEDAEFAYRMARTGGVWYEETLDSIYVPQGTLIGLARQYYRYGRLRAGMVRRHPRSLAARQLAAPLLLAGLLTRRRRVVAGAYAIAVFVAVGREFAHDMAAAAGLVPALPCMHLAWAIGFLTGLVWRKHHGTDVQAGRQQAGASPACLRDRCCYDTTGADVEEV